MFKFRATVVVVLALTFATSGVAAADPVPLRDVVRTVNTIGCAKSPPKNCLHLTVALSSMSINSVPNMAATAFSREAFYSGIATATVAGDDPEWYKGVTNVSVILGAQVGCQISLGANQQIGLGANAIPIQSLSGPSETFFLGPGAMNYFKVADKTVDNAGARKIADMDDAGNITLHVSDYDRGVKFDSCGGPVSFRLTAAARVETVDDNEGVGAYGDIVQI